MNLSTIDMLILIPLLPLILILAAWWLPWGKWMPLDELPKGFTGLYLVYGAFAAWHFKFTWWVVLLLVLGGTGFLAAYVREKLKNRNSSSAKSAVY
jgi:hypothetical protein